MTRLRQRSLACALVVALAGAAASACDPIHTEAVDALGGEAPGVRRGPLHRPGQPCITCHDGAIGDPNEFSVAGTIFVNADSLTPAVGATVTLTNADGTQHALRTNQAGNFYASPSQLALAFPVRVKVSYQGTDVEMSSTIGRDGSCADCHTDPAGPGSAGHIYIPPNGVTP